jgi:hypothetical protein
MRLRTGDIVMLAPRRSSWPAMEWLLEAAVGLQFARVGVVVVNPPFDVPRGTYFWDPTLTRIEDLDVRGAHIVVRRCTRIPDATVLMELHGEAHEGSAFVTHALARLGRVAEVECSAARPCVAYWRDERVGERAWAAMVARRAPCFDDHRACVAKAAASALEVRGARVEHPVGAETSFAVTGALVSVPASAANRDRYDAHAPLLYELSLDGGAAVACTEAELLALAGR